MAAANRHSYIRTPTPTPSPLLPLQAIKREPLKNDRVPFGIQQLGIDVTDTSVSRDVALTAVSLAGVATGIIFVATKVLLVSTKVLLVATKLCL